jgi:hypothetical protein
MRREGAHMDGEERPAAPHTRRRLRGDATLEQPALLGLLPASPRLHATQVAHLDEHDTIRQCTFVLSGFACERTR